jgi:hypothetical protein
MWPPDDEGALRDMLDHAGNVVEAISGRSRADLSALLTKVHRELGRQNRCPKDSAAKGSLRDVVGLHGRRPRVWLRHWCESASSHR